VVQLRRQGPEVVHKVWEGPLVGEACAADAHSLQHTCSKQQQSQLDFFLMPMLHVMVNTCEPSNITSTSQETHVYAYPVKTSASSNS
jgi:hypothetical protein